MECSNNSFSVSSQFQAIPFQECPGYLDGIKVVTDTIASPLYWLAGEVSQLLGYQSLPLPDCAKGHIGTGSAPELAKYNWEIMPFLMSYQHTYGGKGICKLQLGPKVFYIVSDPKIAKEIMLNAKAFVRGNSLRIWRKFSSDGLSEGPISDKFRRQVINIMGELHYTRFFPVVTSIAEGFVNRSKALAQEPGPIDVMRACEEVILEVIGAIILKRHPSDPTEINPFGLTVKNEARRTRFLDAYHKLFRLIAERIPSPLANIPYIGDYLYDLKNWKEAAAFEEAKSTLQAILKPIFKNLIAKPEEIDPDSEFFKRLKNFEIDPFNPDFDLILDHSLGFFQAAFETSSKGLGWTLYLLSAYPDIQKRLRRELHEAFGERQPENLEELREKVPFLFQVIEESLRLYPPFPFQLRDIAKPEMFTHCQVKKNETFIIPPFFINRHKEYWGEDSNEFRPERFTLEMLTYKWQREHPEYATFSLGMHSCVGQHMAKLFEALFVFHMVTNFKIKPYEGESKPVELDFCVTTQPKSSIELSFIPLK